MQTVYSTRLGTGAMSGLLQHAGRARDAGESVVISPFTVGKGVTGVGEKALGERFSTGKLCPKYKWVIVMP